jgi:hypothetical protein
LVTFELLIRRSFYLTNNCAISLPLPPLIFFTTFCASSPKLKRESKSAVRLSDWVKLRSLLLFSIVAPFYLPVGVATPLALPLVWAWVTSNSSLCGTFFGGWWLSERISSFCKFVWKPIHVTRPANFISWFNPKRDCHFPCHVKLNVFFLSNLPFSLKQDLWNAYKSILTFSSSSSVETNLTIFLQLYI